jgi:Tfp pilus assembly protein PilN
MIPSIDFLPTSYHQKRQAQQKTLWRRGVSVVFVALIAAGAFGQWQSRLRLQTTRDGLRKQVADMTIQLAGRDAIKHKIEQLDCQANLIACLRVHTRPTHVLAAVVSSLPEFVTLTELRAAYDADASSALRLPPANQQQTEAAQKSAAQIDLDQLQEDARQNSLFVTLAGIAPDDVAIAQYLVALQETHTFDDVQLHYTDQYTLRDHPLREFEIRLRVRKPGSSERLLKKPGLSEKTGLLRSTDKMRS